MANAMKAAYMRGKKSSGTADAEDATDKSQEKEVERVIIEPSDNGGYTVTCEYKAAVAKGGKSSPMIDLPDDEKHVFGSWDEAASFLDDEFGEGE